MLAENGGRTVPSHSEFKGSEFEICNQGFHLHYNPRSAGGSRLGKKSYEKGSNIIWAQERPTRRRITAPLNFCEYATTGINDYLKDIGV